MEGQADFAEHEVLAEAVFEICGEHFNAHKLGRRIRRMKGRVHGGKFIDDDSAGGGVKRWRVRSADSGFGRSDSARSEVEPKSSPDASGNVDADAEAGNACDNKPTGRDRPETNPSNPPNPPETDSGRGGESGFGGFGGSDSARSDSGALWSQNEANRSGTGSAVEL